MASGLLGSVQAAPLAQKSYEPDPRLQAQDLRRQQQMPVAPEMYPNLQALTPQQQAEQELAFQRAQRSRAEPSPFGPDYDPKADARFVGPPDMSQFPERFAKELEQKSAQFRSKKMSEKDFQAWSREFFGRMADWKQKNANDVPVPVPYALPPMSE